MVAVTIDKLAETVLAQEALSDKELVTMAVKAANERGSWPAHMLADRLMREWQERLWEKRVRKEYSEYRNG